MFKNIEVDTPPGYYLEPVNVNITFSNKVREVLFSLNGAPPSISKYIAYDTSVPPAPFIAATQDGRGNVTYDGGFPKLYNNFAPPAGLPLYNNGLSFKYITYSSSEPLVRLYVKLTTEEVFLSVGDTLTVDINCTSADGITFRFSFYQNGKQYSIPLTVRIGPSSTFATITKKLTADDFAGIDPTLPLQDGGFFLHVPPANVESTVVVKQYLILDSTNAIKYAFLQENTNYTIREGIVETAGGTTLVSVRKATTVDRLNATLKYFYNNVEYVADKEELAKYNRTVLVLGDATTAENYSVKGTGSNQFNVTLTRLLQYGNYTPTFKDRSDYAGGLLDARFPELNQYALVIIMSSVSTGSAFITENCLTDLVTYRESGGGIIIVTDHGPVLNTIEAAYGVYPGSFFNVANKIATKFGAWFSGDYNRVPVNVGHLRTTYGDHPLYDGLLDSESIFAGESESRVFVTSNPSFTPETVTKTFHFPTGSNTIQYAMVLADGSIETARLNYSIVDYKVTFSNGESVRDSGQTMDVFTNDRLKLSITYVGETDRALSGRVFLNSLHIGDYNKPLGGVGKITYLPLMPFGTTGIPIRNDDYIYLRLAPDYAIEYNLRISRGLVNKDNFKNLFTFAQVSSMLNSIQSPGTAIVKIAKILDDVKKSGYTLDKQYTLPATLEVVRRHVSGAGQYLKPDVILTSGSFMAPQSYVGWFLYDTSGNGGNIEPKTYKGIPLRDINSPVDNPLQLQLGSRDVRLPPIVAVFIDGHGPFLKVTSVVDAQTINREWFTDGSFNFYSYFNSKLGKPVEVRFIVS